MHNTQYAIHNAQFKMQNSQIKAKAAASDEEANVHDFSIIAMNEESWTLVSTPTPHICLTLRIIMHDNII